MGQTSPPIPYQTPPPASPEVSEVKKGTMREGCSMRKCKAEQKWIMSTVTDIGPETALNDLNTVLIIYQKNCSAEAPMLKHVTLKIFQYKHSHILCK